jgi:predicted nucleotidyltransferase
MKTSHFSKDIQDFLELLYRHRVKYVIVGGEAVIFYGCARLTGDVDFFFGTFEENAQCLYDTLNEFWGGDIPGVDSFEELMEPGIILQFGVPPNRIDLVNHIDGVTFRESWTGKKIISMNISGRSIPVYFIGLDQLIANKEAIGRPKDLEDLKYLRKTKEDNPS